MTKEEILLSINYNKNQLNSYKTQLGELEEKYAVLEEFSSKCVSYTNSFDESMQRRKNKLLCFDGLLSKVKYAVCYKQKMSEMLTGADYSEVISSIEELQLSVSNEKAKIKEDISYIENMISTLEAKVATLQYEYDTYPEEVVNNGNG